MQLTIERAALLKALGHVQSVVERRNTIPILSNVLLSADRDGVSLAATDLDMEIVDAAGAVIWPGVSTWASAKSTISMSRSVAANDTPLRSAESRTLDRIGMVLRRSTTL